MVLDFTEIKLQEMVDSASTELEYEVAETLQHMYLGGVVDVQFQGGELMFSIVREEPEQFELPI